MGSHPSMFDECRVVGASGELDLSTAPGFTRDLEDVRRGTGRLFLIVDLSGLTFMDGSALDPLCAAWDDCRSRRGWTRVVYAHPCIGLVFRAGALVDRFPRYASARDAWRGTPADDPDQWSATANRSA